MQPDPNDPDLAWPLSVGEPGREVWYSLVSPHDGSLAFWYRYTLLSTADGLQEGRLWAALTDHENPENSQFVTESYPFEEVWPDSDPFGLTIGDGALTSSSATGTIGDVSWELDYEPDTYAFTPLRSETLTNLLSAILGTGKHWSRNQSVFMSGEITVGDRTIELDDAPGHQGHTLSSNPPEEWTWVQCNDFENSDAVLEALRLDDKLSLCFRTDGEVYALNRLKHVLTISPSANSITHDEPGHWRFRGEGEGIELQATIEADPDHWQTVAYMAPDDTPRYNAHCSLSDATVTYSIDGGTTETITSDAARAEWVNTDPPVGEAADYRPTWD
ncbi:MAG: hypothetical protein ACI8UR_001441 [Natronomonas sp.]|jgi:hypothetical protein|uniref:hypothetical protein n=1 Tax=Natronomonas sp. TaxID=2184060 RepID=UPI003989804C